MINQKSVFWICTALLGMGLSRCGESPEAPTELIRPVRSQLVGHQSRATKRTFSGIARAGTETKLSFRVGGIVERVAVKVGQKIQRGDLIASLDEADAKLQLEQNLASEQNAKVQMQTAKANLDRVKGLYENNNVPLSEYENAKNQFAAAESTYESSRKATNLQRSQLAYNQLHAPMAGFVGTVSIEKNENVNPGTQVATLNSDGDIEISFGIPEAFISNVHVGDLAEVTFTALADQRFKGVLSEVSYSIDSDNSTYPVTVQLSGANGGIRPGMVAQVTLDIVPATADNRLVTPAQSVAEDQKGHFVFIVEPLEEGFGTVRRKPVTIGDLTGEGIVIIEGLKDGDRVVTAGINNISDGLKVKLIQ